MYMNAWEKRLGCVLTGTVAIVGIGTRGNDDEAGLALLERLRGRTTAVLFEAEEVPESYVGEIVACRPDTVLLVDAVDFGGAPGEVGLFSQHELTGRPPVSTHRLPLGLVMKYLEAETRARVVLLGIQPDLESREEGLSPAVERTVAALADLLVGLLPAHWAETSGAACACVSALKCLNTRIQSLPGTAVEDKGL